MLQLLLLLIHGTRRYRSYRSYRSYCCYCYASLRVSEKNVAEFTQLRFASYLRIPAPAV